MWKRGRVRRGGYADGPIHRDDAITRKPGADVSGRAKVISGLLPEPIRTGRHPPDGGSLARQRSNARPP
ncbi:hypothetical protein AFCDBAGC_5150 [Methylobacterium cerastii]|uniref:Uncharacterized protein n=1 Tax=Methylobacterium cerastii TaxID=932741 RepID=A0ABQ4QRL4_9HYPH|nr:hypothetical protein AFCDBAGC_5150 [Methylobacterium cerastii]